jgi:bifunctional non-homologous end joining protein LigD
MTVGVKNSEPIMYLDDAKKLADKLIREKMAKGYTEGEDGAAYSSTGYDKSFTGILPMLLNAIPEEELPIFIAKDDWVLQEKYDGRRIMIRKQDGVIDAINRKGLIVGAPQDIINEVKSIDVLGDFILDGEMVGEIYYAFDVIMPGTYGHRLSILEELINSGYGLGHIMKAPTYYGKPGKQWMVESMKKGNYEGVVFKNINSVYTPGRPSTGGVALKCKFTATVNVRVSHINVQRSVRVELNDGTSCGNVTIPPNHDIPYLGTIIEVRYLYAMPNTNALYQPIYSRLRDDIEVVDGIDALKYKKEED